MQHPFKLEPMDDAVVVDTAIGSFIHPVDPTDGEFFWTDCQNGRAMLNYKFGGKWHRWSMPRKSWYFVHELADEPVCVVRKRTKTDNHKFAILSHGQAPK